MLGIADGAKQLASIDITHLKSSTVKMNRARRLVAPDFGPFFSSLVGVITAQEKKLRTRQASHQSSTPMSSGSTIPARKRSPPSSDAVIGTKRTKQTNESTSLHSEPKTPDQPTHPSDTDWSGSTDSSNDEEYPKMLLRDLLLNIREFLDEEFYRITWQRSGHEVDLVQTFLSYFLTRLHVGTETLQSLDWECRRLLQSMMVGSEYDIIACRLATGRNKAGFSTGGISLHIMVSKF
jgi:hypothetical protein